MAYGADRGRKHAYVAGAAALTRENGRVFEADKATLIHLARPLQPALDPSDRLVFGDKSNTHKERVKILGVTLRSENPMNGHVSSKIEARAIRKCMSSRGSAVCTGFRYASCTRWQ